jgi:hypothetical protein
VREIRLHGSEGGAAETNRSFLPLSMLNHARDRSLSAPQDGLGRIPTTKKFMTIGQASR